jgi:hypothetical protein
MPDYQKGKIYKIICNVTGKSYVGSTCEPSLAKRLAKHVTNYKSWCNGKYSYTTSYEILKENNYMIVLIENYPCSSKDELFSRESFWTNEINCINKNKNQGLISSIGKKAYCQQYQRNNKDKILEQKKEYNERNREKTDEYQKQYRQLHKDELSRRRKEEKFNCECGSCCRIVDKPRHNNSIKHKTYFKQKEVENKEEELKNQDDKK